jgi:DNA-binding NarL/FixJ family response regulator
MLPTLTDPGQAGTSKNYVVVSRKLPAAGEPLLARPSDPVAALTARQREILQLFAEGCSTKEIASKLDISPRTVEYHKYQLMDSLKLQGNAELIHFAIKNGIVPV